MSFNKFLRSFAFDSLMVSIWQIRNKAQAPAALLSANFFYPNPDLRPCHAETPVGSYFLNIHYRILLILRLWTFNSLIFDYYLIGKFSVFLRVKVDFVWGELKWNFPFDTVPEMKWKWCFASILCFKCYIFLYLAHLRFQGRRTNPAILLPS